MFPRFASVTLVALALNAVTALPAWAWGADGHHTVGAIASKLIAGTPAEARVHALLGPTTFEQATVWADCAKGIDPKKDYAYTSAGKYPECQPFETPEGIAEMADFVKRNDVNCARDAADESCHKHYHYTDVAIQRPRYTPGLAGTRPYDLIGATQAAMAVLAGQPSPAPFNIQSPREALLLLAHYLGDLHQPLHVGSVYLDEHGALTDPDATGLKPAEDTRGGNQLITIHEPTNRRAANLHQVWDDIPERFQASHVDEAWLKAARQWPRTRGEAATWPAQWANQTLAQARNALGPLQFKGAANGQWTTLVDSRYNDAMSRIKRQQLTAAGARLAQILTSLPLPDQPR